MSQNDFDIANQGFAATRADLNNALKALASNSSGDTAPATPYANQFWYETDTNILHIRNEANSAWLDLMVIDGATGSPSFNSGNVAFDTNTLFVDATNNFVGIGTTSPATALNVIGNIRIEGANPNFAFAETDTTNIDARIRLNDGDLLFETINDAGAQVRENMRIADNGTVFFCGSATSGVFDGDGVNVAAGGEVSINVTSGSPLDINQSTNDNIARSMIRFFRREILNGSITTSSTATAYVTASDYRLKENVQPMTGALGLVAQLNPVTYTWKADGSDGQGFIAHELQAVVPDCVIGEKDAVDADGKPEYQGVDTSFLVATLTAAIQEQQAMIVALEARLTALETQ